MPSYPLNLRSLSSGFQDDLLSWCSEHAASRTTQPLPPAVYARAVPIDVAHDESGSVVALLMRVTYAAPGNRN